MDWQAINEWERNWWGTCQNTFGEEFKQLAYAKRMGLQTLHNGRSPFNFGMQGKLIVDFGGGPCSLLLKCQNVRGIVVDPCDYPRWITDRYLAAGIRHVKVGAEDAQWEDDPSQNPADEIWIYNVLQHVVDPAAVISNAQRQSRLIRLFEWIECGTSEGHPHELTEAVLNRWLQGQGKVEEMNENTAVGRAYFGVFKGNHYGV